MKLANVTEKQNGFSAENREVSVLNVLKEWMEASAATCKVPQTLIIPALTSVSFERNY